MYTRFMYIYIYKHLELVSRGPTKTIAREYQIMVSVFRHVYTFSGSSPNATPNLSFSQVFLIALKFLKKRQHTSLASCVSPFCPRSVCRPNQRPVWMVKFHQYQCGLPSFVHKASDSVKIPSIVNPINLPTTTIHVLAAWWKNS